MKRNAFTLVELLVVIAIIGLLSTVAAMSFTSTRVKSRNTQRKANLVQISKALDLFYNDFGVYPTTAGGWLGTCSWYSSKPDADVLNASPTSCLDFSNSSWIPGLTSCGYMSRLPHDSLTEKVNPTSSSAQCQTSAPGVCYLYRSNGTDYKLMARCLPEGGAVSSTDSFYDPVGRDYAYVIFTPGASAW
jgi:prepilin-type N-terminal cleavage/methylation domain-containing protein